MPIECHGTHIYIGSDLHSLAARRKFFNDYLSEIV